MMRREQMGLRLKLKQKGMIVETLLLGMGAAFVLGVPAYDKYDRRAKINEGFILASMPKAHLTEYWSEHGQFPQGSPQEVHRQVGIAKPEEINGKFVQSVSVGKDGQIRVQYKQAAFDHSALEFSGRLTKDGGYFVWDCAIDSQDARFLRMAEPECFVSDRE